MLPKRIVAIGASLTAGKVDLDVGGFVQRLRLWLEEQDLGSQVFNLGVPAETIDDINQRLDEVKRRKPELIVVLLVTNEMRREGGSKNKPAITMAEFVRKLDQSLKEYLLISPVLGLTTNPIDDSKTTPVAWRDAYYLASDMESYNKQAVEVAQDNNVEVVDLYDQWKEQDYGGWLFDDGLHPNARGHELIFETIKDWMEKKYL